MKTILVPVDFSPVTASVVRAACRLARAARSRLVLLHVVQIPIVVQPYGIGNDAMIGPLITAETRAARKLKALARHCRRLVKTVQTIQYTGQAVPVVIAKAVSLKADCIVVGSHGHGSVFDLVIGSVAQGVLRRAECPVLVVPMQPRSSPRKAGR